MTERTILILGAGIMQLPAIQRAKEMGLRVLVADGNPDAYARERADIFEHVDLRDVDGMIAMAGRHAAHGGLDAVFTAGTDFSATVAAVADSLGLPGIGLDVALNATHKDRMRAVLLEAGVPVPAFVAANDVTPLTLQGAERAVGYPAVVKPVDNMGARGVVRVDNRADLAGAVASALAQSRTSRAIVEQYIPGPEFSIDALVVGDVVHVTGFADRHIRFEPHFIEVGHTIPTAVPEADQARVIEAFSHAVRALGIRDGAAKGDVKLSPTGPVIGEVAARLSGGFMSGWTYPMSSGVDLTGQAIRLALGETDLHLSPSREWTTAERAVISIPGVVRTLHVPEPGPTEDCVWFSRIGPGDTVVFPRSNVEKCGNIICAAPTRRQAVSAAERFVAETLVELECVTEETRRFLSRSRFQAFSLDTPENRQWLASLGRPDWTALARRSLDTSAPLAVGRLPHVERETSRSWSYRTLAEAVERIVADGRVTLDEAPPRVASLFWNAVVRGGWQAGDLIARSLGTEPGGSC